MPASTNMSAGVLNGLKHMLRALRGRNYALFFTGHGFSLIGTWMQSVAISSLVWKLTYKEMSLGLVGFASHIFAFALAPIAGVFSDRWNRRYMLLGTQTLSMLQAVVLAGLTFNGAIQVGHVVALAMFLGLVHAVDMPIRQSFVVQIVRHRDDLPNAIALNSTIFNGARLVGPLLAAMVIPAVSSRHAFPYAGEGACFAINAVSFMTILLALLAMRLPAYRRQPQRHVLHSLKEGATYAFGFRPIRNVLLMLGLMSLVAMPYSVLLPAVVHKVLLGGREEIDLFLLGGRCLTLKFENILGMLLSAAGMGAVLGALFLASRKSVMGLGRLVALAAGIVGVGMVAFALSRFVLLSMAMLVIVGFGLMVLMASSNTILQTLVDEDKRGRVMSFYAMALMGMAPFGALLAGFLGSRFGAANTVMIGGVVSLLASASFAWQLPALSRLARPVYVKLGLLSDTPPIPKAVADADIQRAPKARKPDA